MSSLTGARAVLVAVAAAAVVSGCAGGGPAREGPSPQAGKNSPAGPGAGVAEPLTGAIAISELREQAIGVIEQESLAPDPLIRANAIEAAGSSAARLRPVIERGLSDDNLGVRSVAAATAGRVRLNGAVPLLHGLVMDGSPYVRASAIGALARLGEPVDQTPLSQLLLADASPRIRSHAAFTLGEIGNRSALGLLKQAAGAKMERASPGEVRLLQLQIAEAMVKLGDDAQLQPIRAALYPSRPDELEATALAVQILGQVRDKAAMGQLMHLASYKDPKGQPLPAEIRLAVCSSLAKMGEKRGGFIAEEFYASATPGLRAQAAAAYGDIGDGMSLARLKPMLEDPERVVRVSAAGAVLRAVGGE